MTRRFRPSAGPQEIRRFVEDLGFSTTELHWPDTGEAFGFDICDTYVRVDYDIVRDGLPVAFGGVSHRPSVFDPDPEKAKRSLDLYLKLYRKFRKPPAKSKILLPG